jgi:putative ABC transport system substrate-binding protein
MVGRRKLTLGLLLAAGMRGARAQPKARIYRIAVVSPSQPVSDLGEAGNREFRAFFQRLRQLGYVEGQNLSVERYSANGRTERFTELADEVVRRNPDLIYVSMYRLVRDFKAATDAIPIVGSGGDPIAFGVTTSLARPGGNITGVTVDAGVEIWGKRLDLLREILPGASRVAWLASAAIWKSPYAATLREGAQRLNMTVIGPQLVAPFDEAEYRSVFAAMAQSGADALFVASQAENVTNRRLIVDLAERARLPTIYP